MQRITKHVLTAIKEYYASKQQRFRPNRFISEMVENVMKRDLFPYNIVLHAHVGNPIHFR